MSRDVYRGISDVKRRYHPKTNIVRDEKGADSHSILARWRNHFSQLLNVHGVNDGRQTKTNKAKLPSAFSVEMAIEKL
jgi:hypothetical protein